MGPCTKTRRGILAAGVAGDANEAAGEDAALEEAAQLALDEAWSGAAAVVLAVEEGLQLVAEDLMEDAVLGLAASAAAPG